MEFNVNQSISEVRIAELLSTAFEGGSNYWYLITGFEAPENPRPVIFGDMKVLGGENAEIFKHTDYPLTGGAVVITDCEQPNRGPWRLDGEAIQRGLKVMAEKYPRHWGDFVQENDDADTGDCFLQCCLFGEMVYG